MSKQVRSPLAQQPCLPRTNCAAFSWFCVNWRAESEKRQQACMWVTRMTCFGSEIHEHTHLSLTSEPPKSAKRWRRHPLVTYVFWMMQSNSNQESTDNALISKDCGISRTSCLFRTFHSGRLHIHEREWSARKSQTGPYYSNVTFALVDTEQW